MRAALTTLLVCAAGTAWAKPKVAVVPLAGDLPGNKLSLAVADALGDDFSVVSFKTLAKTTKKTGTLDDDGAAKLEKQLSAEAVVSGKVIKNGSKRSLQLKIAVKGQDTADVVVRLKGATLDDDGKTKIHDELQKSLAALEESEKPPKKTHEDPPEEKVVEKPKRHEDPPEEDKPKPKKRVAEDDDDAVKIKKKHRHRDDDDAAAPKRATQDLFLDVGVGYGMRRLSYDSTSTTPPPTVSTAAASGRVTAELFLKAAGASGGLGNFGFAGEYDRAVGLSIAINAMTSVPIDQGHYSVGARYRIGVGTASVVVLGVDYSNRHYIADRSGLTTASQLDAPDTDYQAAQADIAVRTPFTPAVSGFASASIILPFAAGPIQQSASYGPATVYGLALAAGADIVVASQIALRIAAEADQITLSFKGTGGEAQSRMVTAAADRQLGLVASIALFY